jgi:phosphate acetyltransferase
MMTSWSGTYSPGEQGEKMDVLQKMHKRAKEEPLRIVYPESTEERTLHAVHEVIRQRLAYPILLGDEKKVKKAICKMGHKVDMSKLIIINHRRHPSKDFYAKQLCAMRRHRGMTLEKAKKALQDPIYYGTMMVKLGDADGMIAGAAHTTADTLRPALQIIKTKEQYQRVSGIFLIESKRKTYLFADCAVNIDPDETVLAEIAIDSARTAKELGMRPRVAMLSFSTKGSAEHDVVDKVVKATKIVKRKAPKFVIDGEVQVDAAIVPEVAKIKCPKSGLKGNSNVLIFPNLSVGNIAYKLVERLAKVKAVGPIIQGLAMPVNDLSRGCSIQNIIDLTAITVVQAQDLKRGKTFKVF